MIESHDYHIHLQRIGAKTGRLDGDGLPSLDMAAPPEFGGPGNHWSPEHLYVAAVASCLMTTFGAIAEISNLEVLDYGDNPSGHLQRGDDRLYKMDRVTLRPRVVIADASMTEKTLRLLEKAESVCLISRSVNSEITMEPTVVVHQPMP